MNLFFWKIKLNKIFKKHRVVFAYLFGSQAFQKTGRLSDIDLAVYFEEENTLDFWERKLKLLGDLNDLFKREDIDLVILNDAPPLLAHRILKEGRLLFCQNHKRRLEYEVKAVLQYLDWKPFLEKYTKEVFGSI